ncbi:hypothetical protein X279_05225 [Oenococcus oeni IOEB_0501]|nr:hypothetical protein [Oenococcus oeni]KEP87906.1 hypothetical protein X279_05225 [Oenococcus oeni IOEB_0501]
MTEKIPEEMVKEIDAARRGFNAMGTFKNIPYGNKLSNWLFARDLKGEKDDKIADRVLLLAKYLFNPSDDTLIENKKYEFIHPVLTDEYGNKQKLFKSEQHFFMAAKVRSYSAAKSSFTDDEIKNFPENVTIGLIKTEK